MNTNRQNMLNALEGRRPERIPYTLYGDFYPRHRGTWDQLFSAGLCYMPRVSVVKEVLGGDIEVTTHNKTEGDRELAVTTYKTPHGDLYRSQIVGGSHNGWPVDHLLKTPDDFAAMSYILQNTSLELDDAAFTDMEKRIGDVGMTLVRAERTPYQKICVDYAGLYNFSLLYYEDEFPAFLDVVNEYFLAYYRIVTQCSATYIQIPENLSSIQSGPEKYKKHHMPAYEVILGMLHDAGKRAYVHYDGLIRVLADLIAQTDIDGIESLTLPPEGDMGYREARETFGTKTIWTGISAHVYEKPLEEITRLVVGYLEDATIDGAGVLLEVAEVLPYDYPNTVPAVIEGINRYTENRGA